ncbi:MAG: 4-(cytidine 5'-diphospho)-2-C-methyl-D-erythritol kinase [Clostridia bacterium]|nr:4-(cytidine 5'-diphospho)-2-C-methyl-D-erythritol kinase [Clostridia bacterium]
MKIVVKAFAKINLYLDITGVNDIGYHLLDSIMQSVTLYDEVEIERNESGEIKILCDNPEIPCDERNIAYKAARLFFDKIGCDDRGVTINIKKVIPHQAGLGGGSADAAGVFVALNKLYGANLSQEELCEIGVKVGADVPFCIVGGTKRAQGIGEQFTALPSMPSCSIVIAKPNFGVSTAQAYSDYDKIENPQRLDVCTALTALQNGDVNTLANGLYNAFEQVVPDAELNEIKSVMLQCGAKGCLMSGSGSAIFALFSDETKAKTCADTLNGMGINSHLCVPSADGCQIL